MAAPSEPHLPQHIDDPRGPAGLASRSRGSPRDHPSAAAWPGLMDELRTLQDRITAAAAPPEVVEGLTAALAQWSTRLEPYEVGERDQLTGHLTTVPGRAQTMSPQLYVDSWDYDRMTGHVTYGRHYLGGNGAVHGGAVPLLFDEVLGRLSNTGDRPMSRTAYLHVNFRHITPVGRELRVSAHFDREEGRKRFLVGTLHDGDTLCADAEGLFIALRPGQP